MSIDATVSPAALFAKLDATSAKAVIARVEASGFGFIAGADVLSQVKRVLEDAKGSTPAAVEGACEIITYLAKHLKVHVEPYVVPLLPAVLERLTDKAESVRNAATAAAEAIVGAVSPVSLSVALATLYECLNSKTRKWQTRVGALNLIGELAHGYEAILPTYVPELVPRLSECMGDVRAEVAKAAETAMTHVCNTVGNKDIEKVVPQIISCIARPVEVPECIHALSATTFVQAVEQPTLAILVPLLVRGLTERSTPIKRKTAIIISNMAKLVPEVSHAAPLIPKLLPGLKKLRDEVSDPEVRGVATKAFETLLSAANAKTEEEAMAAAAALAAAVSTTSKATGTDSPKPAAGAGKAAPLKFKSANAKGKAGSKPSTPKPGADSPKPEAEEKEERELEPAVATQLALLTEALSLLNLDLTAALTAKATAAVPAEAAAGAGAETKTETVGSAAAAAAFVTSALEYVATLTASLVEKKNWHVTVWDEAVVPYVLPFVRTMAGLEEEEAGIHKAGALALDLLNRSYFKATGKARVDDEGAGDAEVTDPDAEDLTIPDLCKCEFSLAYGGKILLNSARLHMKKGRKYGLIGPNGCGKSTLMKAIANGQLEGFPSKDVLRTCYVEHDISAAHADLTILQFVLVDPLVRQALEIAPIPPRPEVAAAGAGVVTREMEDAEIAYAKLERDVADASPEAAKAAVAAQLTELGFTPAMMAGLVSGLSGGWKVKLAMARVILSKVELALLDEPTNHLDVINAQWLTDYLVALKDVSLMVVSHDSKFLDAVCTHIVHYEGFRLRTYKGNLSCFVAKKPEAKSYYELAETSITFTFPEPGFLEGVKSKDKAILKMSNATYTYPGRDKPSVIGASLACSLSSRVVIHGRNGAGKSTLVKMLTGEIEAQEGGVWKHPALRIAYVAQNAFHHLEEHMNMTPAEYIQWRYASGEDREALVKVSRVITEEEEKKMAAVQSIGGVKLVIKELLARRKNGRSWEYEVSFVGQPADKNQWMMRDWLESVGWGKAVDALDAREAAAAGLHSKPLTAANVVKHLEGLGLESEFTLHHRIRGLSGGQKIKLVLGAALWQNPHVVVMDEPSNYLDRESLGALANAIKKFEGGVVLITHHADFTRELCSETWTVDEGRVSSTGATWTASAVEVKLAADEVLDAAGNVIKVKKALSEREKKRILKEKIKRRKAGDDDVSDDDDFSRYE